MPRRLTRTDNLRSELLPFLGEYARRTAAGEHNTWIAKPWNLARGIGHVISADQACIMRQLETGPRVASLYVRDPLLFNRRKIDFRCGRHYCHSRTHAQCPVLP